MENQISLKDRVLSFVRNNSMTIIFVSIIIIFQYLTNGLLLKPLNVTNIILQNSYILILAIGMLILIVLNQIDLSVGSIAAVIGAVSGVLMTQFDMPVPVTIMIALAIGGLMGAMQGLWVSYFSVPSFIVTLAGQLLFRGINMIILKGKTVAPLPKSFQVFSSRFVPEFLPEVMGLKTNALIFGAVAIVALVLSQLNSRKNKIKYQIDVETMPKFVAKIAVFTLAIAGFSFLLAQYQGIPIILLILLTLTLLYSFVMNQTKLGRHIYAVGGNIKAAILSGIQAKKLTFLAYVNMGVLAAVSGIVFASRLNAATPQAGVSFELDAIAACYIGGASANGGVGKVVGAIIGGLVMAVLNNGMSLMGIGIDWQQAIKGAVLLAAVSLDVYNRRKAAIN
ncbi:MAG: sugar ABC transporter permease [Erysipelothrix sp.]|nr:sugar ABC transporter permease [Erysipelothrix sp.]